MIYHYLNIIYHLNKQSEDNEEEGEENEDEDEENEDRQGIREEEEDDVVRREVEVEDGEPLNFVHLDSLMNILGTSNRWADTVPKQFIAAVFISGEILQVIILLMMICNQYSLFIAY